MKTYRTLALVAAIASIPLTSCADQEGGADTTPVSGATQAETAITKNNTDPRKGWVVVVDMTDHPATSGGPYKVVSF
jgi:hypothetical protein